MHHCFLAHVSGFQGHRAQQQFLGHVGLQEGAGRYGWPSEAHVGRFSPVGGERVDVHTLRPWVFGRG